MNGYDAPTRTAPRGGDPAESERQAVARTDVRGQQRLATRRKIIAAAEKLIATKGLGAATFEAIAKSAKLSPTLPVFHFKNKNALFTELLHVLSASYIQSW